MLKQTRRFTLNLQHFAEGDVDPTLVPTPGTDPSNPTTPTDDQKIPYDRFKQKVDEANELKRQLAELQTAKDEAARAELEQQSEWKTLYEQAQATIATTKEEALNAKKDALLVQAGYSAEQVAILRGTISGDTDGEIQAAIDGLKTVLAPTPTYIHQTPMGGHQKPPETDPTSFVKSLYDRARKNK